MGKIINGSTASRDKRRTSFGALHSLKCAGQEYRRNCKSLRGSGTGENKRKMKMWEPRRKTREIFQAEDT